MSTRSWPYRAFLLGLAVIPFLQVTRPFQEVQKIYAVMGAAFIPMLAVALLIMNGRARWVGREHRNRALTALVLVIVLALSLLAGYSEVRGTWGG